MHADARVRNTKTDAELAALLHNRHGFMDVAKVSRTQGFTNWTQQNCWTYDGVIYALYHVDGAILIQTSVDGFTWSEARQLFRPYKGRCFAAATSPGGVFYAIVQDDSVSPKTHRLFSSSDLGVTWTAVVNDLSVLIDADSPGIIGGMAFIDATHFVAGVLYENDAEADAYGRFDLAVYDVSTIAAGAISAPVVTNVVPEETGARKWSEPTFVVDDASNVYGLLRGREAGNTPAFFKTTNGFSTVSTYEISQLLPSAGQNFSLVLRPDGETLQTFTFDRSVDGIIQICTANKTDALAGDETDWTLETVGMLQNTVIADATRGHTAAGQPTSLNFGSKIVTLVTSGGGVAGYNEASNAFAIVQDFTANAASLNQLPRTKFQSADWVQAVAYDATSAPSGGRNSAWGRMHICDSGNTTFLLPDDAPTGASVFYYLDPAGANLQIKPGTGNTILHQGRSITDVRLDDFTRFVEFRHVGAGVWELIGNEHGNRLSVVEWAADALELGRGQTKVLITAWSATRTLTVNRTAAQLGNNEITIIDTTGNVSPANPLRISTGDGQPHWITNPYCVVKFVSGIGATQDVLTTGILAPPTSRAGVMALTDGATINWVQYAAGTFTVTLAGDRTLANPGGGSVPNGQRYLFRIKQDATGSRMLAFGTKFNPGPWTVTLSTAANAVDYLEVVYDSTRDKLDVINFQKGY
jgi:hypothetical protein